MRVRLARWGNSLAVRIPKDVVESAGLVEGQELEAEARDGGVALRGLQKRYTLDELLASMPLDAKPPELLDWGPDRGSEALPDDDYARGLITERGLPGRRDDR
ncbi:MAG: AbrB/MazE/SpoVT family DNA-binding domain-containing protein [Rhizobiales bacterium]|nr:AbrB/MazE/SpoVT family DNA-binding domain-containing protein [Hyphomicrobiales bacterium]